MSTAIDALHWIWSQSEGEYVFMPLVGPDRKWIEGPGLRPRGIDQVADVMDADLYFSPLRFDGARRREDVGPALGVVWVDLDYLPAEFWDIVPNWIEGTGLPAPNLLWETSPGHFQAVWALETPIREPGVWREISRKVTDILLPAADVGGWSETKVLRVPHTRNWKRGGVYGRGILLFDRDRRLHTSDVLTHPRAHKVQDTLPPMPPLMNDAQRLKWVSMNWDRIPMSARRWLVMTPEQYENGTVLDRSQLIRSLVLQLREVGLPARTIFGLMHGAPWDKFADRPKSLWREVCKGTLV